jgi:hypothetical protein
MSTTTAPRPVADDATATRSNGVFVNLPVNDLKRAVAFFTALGFRFDPRFTDEKATCMVLGEHQHAMLLQRDYFAGFAPGNKVGDPAQGSQVLVAIGLDSRAQVEALAEAALAHGATRFRPAQDHGFMYQDAFQDLDGHVWEIFHMDMAAFEAMQQGGQ